MRLTHSPLTINPHTGYKWQRKRVRTSADKLPALYLILRAGAGVDAGVGRALWSAGFLIFIRCSQGLLVRRGISPRPRHLAMNCEASDWADNTRTCSFTLGRDSLNIINYHPYGTIYIPIIRFI